MSFFKKIRSESSEFIPLFQIIQEIAYLETVTPNEVAASLLRELEVPFNHSFKLYSYDIADGFTPLKEFQELLVLEQIARTWICPLPEGIHERTKNIEQFGYPTYSEYRAKWKTGKVVIVKQVGDQDHREYNVGIKASEFLLFLKSINAQVPPSIRLISTEAVKNILNKYKSRSSNDVSIPSSENDDVKHLDDVKKIVDGSAEWADFYGKDTALLMIAGMAVALEKSGGKYVRGGKMNKSAIAESAKKAINDHGLGTMLTNRALTELLRTALDSNFPKLEE